MGGQSTKEATAQPVEPVNIIITKEVAERWHQLQKQELQQKMDRLKIEIGMEQRRAAGDATSTDKPVKIEEEANLSESLINGEQKEIGGGEAAATSSSQQRIEQLDTAVWKDTEGVIGGDTTLKDYHDVEKFAQFYLPKDNPKLLEDLEVGSDINEHYLEPEGIYSTFLRKPTSPSTEHDKDVRADVISEITSNKTPPKPKSILVPKAALPVVIDENAEGKATIETVTAWKVREGIEKILSENDKYWSHKLERVTAKAEREMNQEVEKFEKRLRNIEVHHGFSISSPLRRGSHCNMLTSQIGKCYQKNPDEVLKCDTLVRQFAQCTNNAMLAKGVIKK